MHIAGSLERDRRIFVNGITSVDTLTTFLVVGVRRIGAGQINDIGLLTRSFDDERNLLSTTPVLAP